MTIAYEHLNRNHGNCFENSKVSDPDKVLGIPSAVDSTTAQFAILKAEPGAHVGFSMYACQMSHTSKGGLWRVLSGWRKSDSFEIQR